MSVNVYSTLPIHERPECEDEKGNVGAAAAFVDVESPDMILVVDVV